MNLEIYSNFLNEEEHNYVVEKTINSNQWSFIGQSDYENPKFWFLELNDDDFFTKIFLEKIQDVTKREFDIIQVYANGQTYGLSGNMHPDAPEGKTFLYYVNPFWDYEWGGNTLFVKTQQQYHLQPFIPNTGILFDSDINHVGLEPTRHCKELRVTVAFKMKQIIGES